MLVFNFDYLNDYSEGDEKLERHLVTLLCENLKRDIAELDDYFQKADFVNWADSAHKIFGATSHIGAERLAVICNKAQHASKEQRKTIEKLHGYIQHEYDVLQKTLEKTYS